MPTNYPGSIDSFSNPTDTSYMDDTGVYHDEQHANVNDAVEAIEGELGTDPAGGASTVKARLDSADSALTSGLSTKAPLASPAFTGSITINGLALNASPTVYDITRGSNRTLSDTVMTGSEDAVLTFPVAANETWDVDLYLEFESDGGDDLKVTLVVPSGCAINGTAHGQVSTASADGASMNWYQITASDSPTQVWGGRGLGTPTSCRASVRIVNGATAGDFDIKIAKNADTAGDGVLRSASNLLAVKKM
jgi:hypothetical protein